MLKAVISDDEMKVCALIQALVDWDKVGVKLVGVGYDGYETLDLIRKHKPEIVITDIRMPGMDGMELIKKVREEGILTNFIVISGYRQFEFARKAIKYGVNDYLLKPISKDELMAAIKKICSQYDDKTSIIEKGQGDKNRKLLQQHFLAHYTFENGEDNTYDSEKVNEMCHLNFNNGYYQVMLVKVDGSKDTLAEEYETAFKSVQTSAELFLKEHCNEIVCFIKDSAVFGILNYTNKPENLLFFKDMLDEISGSTLDADGLKLTICLGGIKKEFSEIRSSAFEAVDANKCRVVFGTGKIIDFTDLPIDIPVLNDILGVEWRRQYSTMLEMLDPKGMKELMNEFFEKIEGSQITDPRLYHELCETCISIAVEVLHYSDNVNGENKITYANQKLLNSQSTTEMMEIINLWLKRRINLTLADRIQHERLPIRKVKQYIKENYMNKISLEDAAEEVHFNSSYLSVMFKSEVGINFNDYLVQIRIDAAKELLRKGELNMDNVSMSVGYQNTKYFSRLFKKIVGITPSNYRKLYS